MAVPHQVTNASTTVRPAPPLDADPERRTRVLIVDDDAMLRKATARVLESAGFQAEVAADGIAAADLLLQGGFDAVVTDINMPGTSGVDLLRTIRAYDMDLPVILVTGSPTVESAASAVELGAMLYLVKPVAPRELTSVVTRAVQKNRLAQTRREALRAFGDGSPEGEPSDRAALAASFDRALESIWIAFQPIVDLKKNTILGYEALVRSREPSLLSPLGLLRAAEQLGRLLELAHRIRKDTIHAFAQLPNKDALLFLNLHTSELLDGALYEAGSVLSDFAQRIVLEVTERGALDKLQDVSARASVLRFHGFRLAIDDLGAGYAGLTSLVSLEPEFVKLDMALVRGIDASPIRQHILRSIVDLAGKLKMQVVAEGVETASELRTIRLLGCHFAQGFFIGRPCEDFVPISGLKMGLTPGASAQAVRSADRKPR